MTPVSPREIAQEIVKRWGEQQRTPGQSPDLAGLIAEALAAEREAWRPIETAPKDGTAVLLFRQLDGSDGYWLVGWWQEADAGWFWGSHKLLREAMAPTHWMPLPTPPAIRTGRSEGTP
jgi:hypothetical protein